jgi:hypothetical protein
MSSLLSEGMKEHWEKLKASMEIADVAFIIQTGSELSPRGVFHT